MNHTCEVCCTDMSQHPQPGGELEEVRFLIPPCCPGCTCGSFEEAVRNSKSAKEPE